MKTREQADAVEAEAIRRLVAGAHGLVRAHERVQHLRNMGGLYARALKELLAAARSFAAKSDEAWATEIVELRAALESAGDAHSSEGDQPKT